MVPKERLDTIKKIADALTLPEPGTKIEYPDSFFSKSFEEYKKRLKSKRKFSSASIQHLASWATYQRWIQVPFEHISTSEELSTEEYEMFHFYVKKDLNSDTGLH